MTSLYDTLGVPRDADLATINAAYRRAAREHHPDAGGDAASFAHLHHAVAVLRDPERRAHYDATGETKDRGDTTRTEAVQAMVQAFQNALGRCEETFHQRDIIATADADLAGELAKLVEERRDTLTIQRRLADATSRLRHKGEDEDFIGTALRGRAETIGNLLAAFDHREAVLTMSRELLKAYGWTFEAPMARAQDAASMMQYGFGQLGGFAGYKPFPGV